MSCLLRQQQFAGRHKSLRAAASSSHGAEGKGSKRSRGQAADEGEKEERCEPLISFKLWYLLPAVLLPVPPQMVFDTRSDSLYLLLAAQRAKEAKVIRSKWSRGQVPRCIFAVVGCGVGMAVHVGLCTPDYSCRRCHSPGMICGACFARYADSHLQ